MLRLAPDLQAARRFVSAAGGPSRCGWPPISKRLGG